MHTVGLVGVNGNVGAPTAKLLIKAAEEGKINTVIFHRANTDLSGLSKGKNVEFRILNFDDTPDKIGEVVKGVNIFMSALPISSLRLAQRLTISQFSGRLRRSPFRAEPRRRDRTVQGSRHLHPFCVLHHVGESGL